MPTNVEFKKTSAKTGDLEGANISWSCNALVNVTVTEAPHRVVPHYAFGGSYVEFASCPPPAYANVTLTTALSSATNLMLTLADGKNFKAVRLHALYVTVISDEKSKTGEIIELLPQYIAINLDMTNPTLANISSYGPVVKRSTTTGLKELEIDFSKEEHQISLGLEQKDGNVTKVTENIETISFRANFIQDLILTSKGPYIRTYGIQAPEILLTGTTEGTLPVGSTGPNGDNLLLIVTDAKKASKRFKITVTNFGYEMVPGFKKLIRYNIQGLIT